MKSQVIIKTRWSKSRAEATWGYNMCSVKVEEAGQTRRYRHIGGGYDLHGACLGKWLDEYLTEKEKRSLVGKHRAVIQDGHGKGKTAIRGARGADSMIAIMLEFGEVTYIGRDVIIFTRTKKKKGF